MEIWKDIIGYECKYQVSNLGNVKSLKDRYGNYREKILKLRKNKYNYLQVGLCKDGKHKTYKVHRLVAEAFLPKVEGKTHVDHIDGNRSNNVYTNLRWCTPKENSNFELCKKHQSESQKGKKHHMYGKHCTEETKRKMREANGKKVICLETEKIFGSTYEAGRELGIDQGSICKCCRGGRKTAGGFHWKYL